MKAWLKRRAPNREVLLGNRVLRPFAKYLASPNLWHFNRHSVPRGVAVGLFCGVLIPVAHTPIAVLAAAPFRANAIVAAASTWLVNPLTIGPLLMSAHWIGGRIAGQVDGGLVPGVRLSWLHRAMDAAGVTMIGLLPIAVAAAAIGYGLMLAAWRLNTLRRWSKRRAT